MKNNKAIATLVLSGLTLFGLSGCSLIDNKIESEDSVQQSNSASTEASTSSHTASNPENEEIAALEEQLVETPDVHSSDWNLILVNRANQLVEDLDFEPYTASSGEVIDARISQDYEDMIAAGEAAGLQFIFESGYRSYAYQEQIYNNVYNNHLNNGYSEDEARAMTDEFIAFPGTSEHMTGLALDITDPSLHHIENGLIVEFEETASAQWLYDHAAEYGFVLRYPRGKEGIIDVNYESWHFRYVGRESAQFMKANGLALEEYIAMLKSNEAIREQISALSE